MSEYCPWVKVDYRVHALTPAVGPWAFSPSERYLAWAEGLEHRAVHVTELPSMRTVCEIAAPDVASLSWVGDEVLRVVRRDRDRVVVARHGVPDGGELGSASVPRDGFVTGVQASADGRVALLYATGYAPKGAPARAFLVGAAGDDEASALPLTHPRVPVSARSLQPVFHCSLSPDGRAVAVCQIEAIGGGALWFAAVGGASSESVALPMGTSLLGWLSPTRVLLHTLAEGGALLVADRDGSCAPLTKARVGAPVDGAFDLHPERDQLLLCVQGVVGSRDRTLALCVGVDGAAPTAIRLSAIGASDGGLRDGGACWDPQGAVVTLTQSPRGVANLTRRHTVRGPGARLAHFKLIGEGPVDLALAASPGRERFAMTWRSFDRGPSDPVRRLALFAP